MNYYLIIISIIVKSILKIDFNFGKTIFNYLSIYYSVKDNMSVFDFKKVISGKCSKKGDLKRINPMHISRYIERYLETNNEDIENTLLEIWNKIKIYKNDDDYLKYKSNDKSIWYYNDDFYISKISTIDHLIFEGKIEDMEFYLSKSRSTMKTTCYYSHHCRCCDECKGVFEFYGKVRGHIRSLKLIEKDQIYKMGCSGCMSNMNYSLMGYYNIVGKFKVFLSNVTYADNSTYQGSWCNSWPVGYGMMAFRKPSYKKSEVIRTIKYYGSWHYGKLDTDSKFMCKVYYKNVPYFKYSIINGEIEDKYYCPHGKADIYYIKNKSMFSYYNGSVKHLKREGIGKLTFCDKDFHLKSYEGEFLNNEYSFGKMTFNDKNSCYKSFEGSYSDGYPTYGERISSNGIVYKGYVNKTFAANGEGTLDRTNFNPDYKCCADTECFSNYNNSFKTYSSSPKKQLFDAMFDTVTGIFVEGEFIFEHEPSDTCDFKRGCRNKMTRVCLDCKKYLCDECYACHQKKRTRHKPSGKYYIKHSIIKPNFSIKCMDVDDSSFSSTSKKKMFDKSSTNVDIIEKVITNVKDSCCQDKESALRKLTNLRNSLKKEIRNFTSSNPGDILDLKIYPDTVETEIRSPYCTVAKSKKVIKLDADENSFICKSVKDEARKEAIPPEFDETIDDSLLFPSFDDVLKEIKDENDGENINFSKLLPRKKKISSESNNKPKPQPKSKPNKSKVKKGKKGKKKK